MNGHKLTLALLIASGALLNGCATPIDTQPSHTKILAPDEADNIGGSFLESADIRTIASRMGAEILALPEISGGEGPARIAVAPVRNSTRYVFDKDLLTQKLLTELMRYGQGRVRFFQQGAQAAPIRAAILSERDENLWDEVLDRAAEEIANCAVMRGAAGQIRVAVLPAKNINLTDMNAESFLRMLRAKTRERCGERVTFLAGEGKAVDYWLTGEFIAESIMNEQVETQDVAAIGWSRSTDGRIQVTGSGVAMSGSESGAAVATVSSSRAKPNVAKKLNIMLVKASSGEIAFERLITLENKVKTGLGKANLLLTGEVKGLSKASGGDRSDYVNVVFQLSDPETNEILWNGEYETKKVTDRGAVYQ